VKFVAITACPTGIAHTYMAAEALTEAAKAGGHEIFIETQGSAGSEPLDLQTIADADAVIFAADVEVRDRDRFAGKPLVQGPVKRAISHAPAMLAEAEEAAKAAPVAAAVTPAAGGDGGERPVIPARTGGGGGGGAPGFGTRLRGWLMTGVSYMIPFVAAGGILIALGFLLGGGEVAAKVYGGSWQGGPEYPALVDFNSTPAIDLTKLLSQAGWAGVLFLLGKIAFGMLVPILAGFIAYAMADRPGLVPGVVAGLLASYIGAGFLGGLIGGLLAGAVAMYLVRLKVPKALAGVMPVVVIPLVATLIIGVLMLLVIGRPLAAVQTGLTDWLGGLSGSNAVFLGLLLGLMMAFDMGGPVNKVAYTFGLASLASGNTKVMAAVMAAGMVPPIALALATVLRKHLFSDAERKAGEAAWLLGASFVTEGAIPFAAADPLRVIPSLMGASAVTGALSMAFGAGSRAPHGGIWVIGLIERPILWFLSILVGVAVGAALVIVLKSLGRRVSDEEIEAEAEGHALPGRRAATA
jgi:PTS system fructose-specific IIC component